MNQPINKIFILISLLGLGLGILSISGIYSLAQKQKQDMDQQSGFFVSTLCSALAIDDPRFHLVQSISTSTPPVVEPVCIFSPQQTGSAATK